MEHQKTGLATLDGVGFTLELSWDSDDEQDIVTGTLRLSSKTKQADVVTRRVELLPRFPQMFSFQGAYIHLSLVANQSTRALHISMPTPQSRQWRGVLAKWERPTPKLDRLSSVMLNMKNF